MGYYCAGMNKRATVRVHGNAGPGIAENMMSGRVLVDGNASQSAGATGRGGLLVVRGDASARCGISMKGIDIVVGGSVGHLSAFMAQTGCLVVCGDAGEALGDSIYEARLYVRGEVAGLGADCVEKDMRPGARRHSLRACWRPRASTPTRPTSVGTARRASSTTSRSTTPGRTSGDRHRASLEPPRVVPLRSHGDRGDPARRARGHLRHPRLRREAPRAALRRPALPRREHLALSARGLPRALRDRRHSRDALREEAARAEDPGDDRRHELRGALGAREGGARTRRDRGRHVDDDRRRRHDAPRSASTRRRSSTSCFRRATG